MAFSKEKPTCITSMVDIALKSIPSRSLSYPTLNKSNSISGAKNAALDMVNVMLLVL